VRNTERFWWSFYKNSDGKSDIGEAMAERGMASRAVEIWEVDEATLPDKR
jgi:hypothetical protein